MGAEIVGTLPNHLFQDRLGLRRLTDLIVNATEHRHRGDEARIDFQAVLEHRRRFLPHSGLDIGFRKRHERFGARVLGERGSQPIDISCQSGINAVW